MSWVKFDHFLKLKFNPIEFFKKIRINLNFFKLILDYLKSIFSFYSI